MNLDDARRKRQNDMLVKALREVEDARGDLLSSNLLLKERVAELETLNRLLTNELNTLRVSTKIHEQEHSALLEAAKVVSTQLDESILVLIDVRRNQEKAVEDERFACEQLDKAKKYLNAIQTEYDLVMEKFPKLYTHHGFGKFRSRK